MLVRFCHRLRATQFALRNILIFRFGAYAGACPHPSAREAPCQSAGFRYLLLLLLLVAESAFGNEYTAIAGSNSTSLSYCRLSNRLCYWPNDIDFGGIRDLAIDPSNPGVFWAATYASRTDRDIELLRIDAGSNSFPKKYSLNTDQQIRGLAIDPVDGQFYGIMNDEFVRLDPNTGSVDSVGPLNAEVGRFRSPLDFDAEGNLFGYVGADLVQIDTSTGKATAIATIENVGLNGIAFHPETNVLHGVGSGSGGVGYQFFDIDPMAGIATVSGPSNARQAGLVFVSPSLNCNDDGSVDVADLECQSVLNVGEFLEEFNLIVGDFDADGKVGFSDFLILSSNFDRPRERGRYSYAEGDADLNGGVYFDDFLLLSANFGQTSLGVMKSVPEPSELIPRWLVVLFVCNFARWQRAENRLDCEHVAQVPSGVAGR